VGPIAQWFNAALAHHHAGQNAEAERVCRQILVIDPDHAQNLHVLGLTEGVVYRCRRFEYPLVGADTNSTILQDYRPHHLAQCSHCEIVERPGSHWTHRWRRQSRANPSLKSAINQNVMSQFPTHPNREFFAALQGI
jgi:hypothetical protein